MSTEDESFRPSYRKWPNPTPTALAELHRWSKACSYSPVRRKGLPIFFGAHVSPNGSLRNWGLGPMEFDRWSLRERAASPTSLWRLRSNHIVLDLYRTARFGIARARKEMAVRGPV